MTSRVTALKKKHALGFTLIEVMMAAAIIAVLAAVAFPSYRDYVVRSSRSAAQGELLELLNLQEKIYLNSSAYATSMTNAYNGTSAGGLGKTGTSQDGKYTIAFVAGNTGQVYTITATPVTGSTQANASDGTFSISSQGIRSCSSTKTWCKNSKW